MPITIDELLDDEIAQPQQRTSFQKGLLSLPGKSLEISTLVDDSFSGFSGDNTEDVGDSNQASILEHLTEAIHERDCWATTDLLNRHQTLNLDTPISDSTGRTLMHLAAAVGFPEGIKELFLAGANINAPDYSGATPLHFASAEGHTNAIMALAQLGAKPNLVDECGDSALHYAVRNSHSSVIPALIASNVNPRLVNDDDETAFDMAIEYNEAEISNLLRDLSTRYRVAKSTPFITMI